MTSAIPEARTTYPRRRRIRLIVTSFAATLGLMGAVAVAALRTTPTVVACATTYTLVNGMDWVTALWSGGPGFPGQTQTNDCATIQLSQTTQLTGTNITLAGLTVQQTSSSIVLPAVVDIASGSGITVVGNGNISGLFAKGKVVVSAGGVLTIDQGTQSVGSNGEIHVSDGTLVTQNTGAVVVNASGQLNVGDTSGLTGGTVTVNNADGISIGVSGQANLWKGDLNGTGSWAVGPVTSTSGGALLNIGPPGPVAIDATSMAVGQGSQLSINSGTVTLSNSALLKALSGGTVVLGSGLPTIVPGTGTSSIVIDAGGNLAKIGSGDQTVGVPVFNSGLVRTDAAGILRLAAGGSHGSDFLINTSLADIVFEGTHTFAAGVLTDPGGLGGFANNGTMNINGPLIVDGGTLTNNSFVFWGAGPITLNNGAVLDNAISGTIVATADAPISSSIGAGSFNNAGVFQKNGPTGTSNIAVPVMNSGSIEISTGIVDILAPYTQTAGSSLSMLLGGTTAGTQYGQLVVRPDPALDGNLGIGLSYTPIVGDTFQVLSVPDGTCCVGNFATRSYPALSPGQFWTETFDAAGLRLRVDQTVSDLSINKSASAGTVATGAPLTYTIDVSNLGPDAAPNVTVADTLPAGMTGTASGPGWSCTGTTSISCTLSSLAVGPAPPITIVTTAPATAGLITNTATVISASSDPIPANNSSSVSVNVAAPGTSAIVTNLNDSGPGSLRAALELAAGGVCVPCNITFNIPTPGPILVLTDLPVPSTTINVDARTQPGYAGAPLVGVDGSSCFGCDGFSLQGAGSAMAGLAIYNFSVGGAVWLEGAGSHTFTDNWVGINLSGAAALNLGGVIIDNADNMTVANNVISGNDFGIFIFGGTLSTNNQITGNFIGTGPGGTGAIPNNYGIAIDPVSTNTTITSNTIANNTSAGVAIVDGTGHLILGNSMFANGLAIDLGADGPTANDLGDADLGANNLQNFPVINSATVTSSGIATVSLTVDSAATTAGSIQLEIFKADASGQGQTLLTSGCRTGNSFTETPIFSAPGLLGGDFIVATATSYTDTSCTVRGDGTSEFSAAFQVVCNPSPVTLTAPAAVCANGPGSASATVVAGATYLWAITNGTITSGAGTSAITFTAGPSGSVGLSLSVTNSCGAVTNVAASVPITVPTASITPSGPTDFCQGGSVTLTANAGSSYLWSTGATTQSLVVSTAGSYSVTVTDISGCAATSAPVSVTVKAAPVATISGQTSFCPGESPATLTVSGSNISSILWSTGATTASITVSPSATTTYTATVTSPDGCSVVLSHTVTAGGGGSPLTVLGPGTVVAFSTGNVASILSAPSGTYTWVAINGEIASGQGTPEITFTAGASGSVTLFVTLEGGGCPSNGALVIPILSCSTTPPSLVSPGPDATGLTSPVTYSWTAVPGAIGYDVWLVMDTGAPPAFVGSTLAPATSLTAPVPSGTFSWFVTANLPQGCDPARLTSESRTATVAPSTNCPTAAPTLVSPANNANTFSPVTFMWTDVEGELGYRVMASLDGLPAAEIDATAANVTQLVAAVPVGAVEWWIEVLYPGCPPVESARGRFNVQLEECSKHEAPTLLLPANNSTATSSLIAFSWTAAEGADGYAVWVTLEDGPAIVGTTLGALSLTAIIPPGEREWYVEAKFEGCPSTESERRLIQVPQASNCTTVVPALQAPAAGDVVTTPLVTFSWSGVPNTLLYEVWLSVADGADALIGSTAATSLTAEVPVGEIQWFVRARVNGCPDRDSARRTLRYSPPAACSTAIPILLLPLDDGRPISSPVTFRWTAVPGASQYRLYLIRGNSALAELMATTSVPEAEVTVPNGESRWFAEANFINCPSTRSSQSRFVAVPPPTSCTTLGAPVISVPGQVSADTSYTVQWTSVPGAESYVLIESMGSESRSLAVDGQTAVFTYPNNSPSAQTRIYRVRAVDNDCKPPELGPLSAALGVSILPARTDEASTVIGSHATVQQVISIGSEFAGQTFTATPTQPWITVAPSTGVVPSGGIDLIVTADITGLPLGTSVAGVTITFGTAGGGRYTTTSNHTTNTSVSVNLVTPMTSTPKSTPPPDALIIPAVAHAEGINAQFQSDVRVSNTSARVMKYQITFIPTGETGITQGRQTTLDIAPGRTIALDNVLQSWFGTGGASVLGTLEVRPLTQSGSSTSSAAAKGVPNFVTFASSRTFNLTPNGTFGTYIAAVPFANFLGKPADAATSAILSLQQIAQSNQYRTNLGFVEGSGNPVELLVSVFNATGGKVTEFPVALNGGQHTQMGGFLEEQLEEGRVEVKITSGIGKVTAYAAVVNNATGDSLVVSPATLGETGSAKYVLPGVAELSAGVPWQTDVRLFNAGNQPVTATLTLQSLNDNPPQQTTLELLPGQVRLLDRVLATLFGVSNDGGALHITTAANSSLVATARTYRPSGDGGNFGQFIQAVTPDEAVGVGSRPLQILQVEESPRFRSNVGLAEVTGKPVKVEVTVVPPDSKVSAKIQVDLAGNQFRQLNALLAAMGLTGTHNARVTVRAVSGEGRVTAYAATIDAITQDPTFIPAQ